MRNFEHDAYRGAVTTVAGSEAPSAHCLDGGLVEHRHRLDHVQAPVFDSPCSVEGQPQHDGPLDAFAPRGQRVLGAHARETDGGRTSSLEGSGRSCVPSGHPAVPPLHAGSRVRGRWTLGRSACRRSGRWFRRSALWDAPAWQFASVGFRDARGASMAGGLETRPLAGAVWGAGSSARVTRMGSVVLWPRTTSGPLRLQRITAWSKAARIPEAAMRPRSALVEISLAAMVRSRRSGRRAPRSGRPA